MGKLQVDIICTTDSMIFNFLLPYVSFFYSRGYEVTCYCSNTGSHFNLLKQRGINLIEIPFTRNPVSVQNIHAFVKLVHSADKNKRRIVFCHEPVGGVMGRLYGRYLNSPVIYMCHGFHFFKGAPKVNWLLYYPIEKAMSHITDTLITINQEDYQFALKNMKSSRVEYLPGVGINLNIYRKDEAKRITKRKELGLDENDIALLAVGELNANKNHVVILEAMHNLNNSKIHFFIAGTGETEQYLLNKAREYGVERYFHLLGYRMDCCELYLAADVFVIPSFREGLPVALMEAMASGLPVVASKIRGNIDLIDKNGGFLSEPDDLDLFTVEINRLANEKNLRDSMGNYNTNRVEQFSIDAVLSRFSSIVDKVIEENE